MIRCSICLSLLLAVLGAGSARGQEPANPLDATIAEKAPDDGQIKTFKLSHMPAKDAEKMILQLFGKDLGTLAADERSNQLIVRDESPDTLKQVEAILLKVDDAAKGKSLEGAGNPYSPMNPLLPAPILDPMPVPPVGGSQPGTMPGGPTWGKVHEVDQAKAGYQASEQLAAQLAAQVRVLAKTQPNDPKLPALRQQLHDAVAAAFLRRHNLHKLELAELEKRVQAVQQSLAAREKIRDQIIERRVEELLNPNVNWESGPENRPQNARRPIAQVPPKVQGVILMAAPEKNLVEISLGSNDGLALKSTLHVFTENQGSGIL